MTQVELADALHLKQPQLSRWIKKGCPTDSVEAASDWIRANTQQRKRTIPLKKARGKRSKPAPVSIPADVHSWAARLERARQTEYSLYQSLQEAIANGYTSQLNQLRSNHANATKAIAEAERLAADVQTATGELIPRQTVVTLLTEVVMPLRAELDALPLRERGRCNPEHPEVAEAALKDAVSGLLDRISTLTSQF